MSCGVFALPPFTLTLRKQFVLSHKGVTLICILRIFFHQKRYATIYVLSYCEPNTIPATTSHYQFSNQQHLSCKRCLFIGSPCPSSQTKEKERQKTINFVRHKSRGSVATVQPRLRREASETSPQGKKSLRPTVLPPFTPVSSKSPSLDRTGQDRTVRQRANGASQADTHTRTEGEGEEGEGEAEDQEDAATVLQKFPPQFLSLPFPARWKKVKKRAKRKERERELQSSPSRMRGLTANTRLRACLAAYCLLVFNR